MCIQEVMPPIGCNCDSCNVDCGVKVKKKKRRKSK